MNITVIGSHLCPDTLLALCKLREAGIDVDFKNLSASLPDLKAYLSAVSYTHLPARQPDHGRPDPHQDKENGPHHGKYRAGRGQGRTL